MKMKKLLASALAAAMVVSSMIGTMVTSAATSVGTITAGTVNAVVGETDTVTANINIAFPEGVVAPHNIITVALNGYNLSNVALGVVTYTSDTEGVVSIDADGSNLAAGKILLECPVDATAPTVTAIALTATFVDADDVDTAAGTYPIVVSADDMTDVNEADIAIDAVNGSLVVAEPHVCSAGVATPNNDGTHDIACKGCELLFADNEPCTYVDGACSVCGYAEPVSGPVLDENINYGLHSVSLGDTFGVGFRFQLDTIPAEANTFRLDIKRTTSTAQFNFDYKYDSLNTFVKNVNGNLLICTTTYRGIQLSSLAAPIEYTLHCFDAEGTEIAYSKTFTTTLAEIAVNYHDSTSNVAVKRVLADAVQVGAAALNYFTDNRTKDCEYSTLPLPTIVSDYITTELGALADFNSSEGTPITITGGLKESFYFNMRFAGNIADKEQYRYEISFYHGTQKKTLNYDVTSEALLGNATTIATSFTTFPLHATNADVTFTLYRNDEVIGTSHYCLDKYIADTLAKSSNETMKTLLQELGELSQSFRAYAYK